MASSTTARGIEFSYLERGASDAPLALVLHGFPDSPVSFTALLDDLGDAGYHAVAPWMRGYAPTSIIPNANYSVGALAADANALHEALGGDERAVLIGHDWGAAATYTALSAAPARWRRGVGMAVPPNPLVLGAMASIDQLHRSWYMWLFNTPLGVPVAGANDLALVDYLWATWSPGLEPADAATPIAGVKAALGAPANLDAALAYYRSLFTPPPEDEAALAAQTAGASMPPVPVLYLHGEDDGCMGIDVIGDPLGVLAEGSAYVRVPQAGHFLQVERPSFVSEQIRQFLSS